MQKAETEQFSVVLGGPLYQLAVRCRLIEPPFGLVTRRIAVAIVVTWLPLLALALAAGTAFGGVRMPFLRDPEVHVRLLVALPLLLAAEPIVHQRLAEALRQFIERGIVRAQDRSRVEAMVADIARLRNSVPIELVLAFAALGIGTWIWRQEFAPRGIDNWALAAAPLGEEALSAAGAWYAFVSLGLFRFVLLRWYFRLLLWYLFAWRISRLPLELNALHPDRAAGLGFLGNTLNAVAPILVAQSATVAGAIAGQLIHQGAKLQPFFLDIATVVVVLVLMGVLPLAFFAPALLRAGMRARLDYGAFAMRYVDEFRGKWLRGRAAPPEPLVGSSDIQSLADLANAHEVLRQTSMLPLSLQSLGRFAVLIALPFAPLVFSLIPLNVLIARVVQKLI